jgi:hypothetical protein
MYRSKKLIKRLSFTRAVEPQVDRYPDIYREYVPISFFRKGKLEINEIIGDVRN